MQKAARCALLLAILFNSCGHAASKWIGNESQFGRGNITFAGSNVACGIASRQDKNHARVVRLGICEEAISDVDEQIRQNEAMYAAARSRFDFRFWNGHGKFGGQTHIWKNWVTRHPAKLVCPLANFDVRLAQFLQFSGRVGWHPDYGLIRIFPSDFTEVVQKKTRVQVDTICGSFSSVAQVVGYRNICTALIESKIAGDGESGVNPRSLARNQLLATKPLHRGDSSFQHVALITKGDKLEKQNEKSGYADADSPPINLGFSFSVFSFDRLSQHPFFDRWPVRFDSDLCRSQHLEFLANVTR